MPPASSRPTDDWYRYASRLLKVPRYNVAYMQIATTLLSAGLALLGRWAQLHLGKFVPAGHFTGSDRFRLRLFRGQVAALGTLAVSCGTYLALRGLLQFATIGDVAPGWITTVIASGLAIVAAVYVRREVTIRTEHKNRN